MPQPIADNTSVLAPPEPWSIREQLALCSAVLQCGDQNWGAISRLVRFFADPGRLEDWCLPKNCAKQYAALLDSTDATRRRSEVSSFGISWGELLVKRLTVERVEQLQEEIRADEVEFKRIKSQIGEIESGKLDHKLDDLWSHIKSTDPGALSESDLEDQEEDQSLSDGLKLEAKISTSEDVKEDQMITSPRLTRASRVLVSTEMKPSSVSDDSKGRGSSIKKVSSPTTDPTRDQRPSLRGASAKKKATGGSDAPPLEGEERDTWTVLQDECEVHIPEESPPQRTTRSRAGGSSGGKIQRLVLRRSPDKAAHPRGSSGADTGNWSPQHAPGSPSARSRASSSTSATTAMTLSSSSRSSERTVMPEEMQQANLEIPLSGSSDRAARHNLRERLKAAAEEEEEAQLATALSLSSSAMERLEDQANSDPDEGEDGNSTSSDENGGARNWRKSVLTFLTTALTHRHSSVFSRPVTDDIAKGYSRVIRFPMDLTTLRKRIESFEVNSPVEFQRDLMLVFSNAIMYNNCDHIVHKMAQEMFVEVVRSIEECLSASIPNIVLTPKFLSPKSDIASKRKRLTSTDEPSPTRKTGRFSFT